MKNICKYVLEHPEMFQGCADATSLMEKAYEAWRDIAPTDKSDEETFLDAFLGWEDITQGCALYGAEVSMLHDAAKSSGTKFTTEEWDTVIEAFFESYFNLGYAPIVDATDGKKFGFLFENPNFDKQSTVTSAYKTLEEFLTACRSQMDND